MPDGGDLDTRGVNGFAKAFANSLFLAKTCSNSALSLASLFLVSSSICCLSRSLSLFTWSNFGSLYVRCLAE